MCERVYVAFTISYGLVQSLTRAATSNGYISVDRQLSQSGGELSPGSPSQENHLQIQLSETKG